MATYTTNQITRKVTGDIPAYRLVKSENGNIALAGADDDIYGAVLEAGSETADTLPRHLRVHAGQAVVALETEDDGFTEGDKVYAAANGMVAKAGTNAVGIVDLAEHTKRGVKTVRVNLFHPAAQNA